MVDGVEVSDAVAPLQGAELSLVRFTRACASLQPGLLHDGLSARD